jgi:hypothetical protein
MTRMSVTLLIAAIAVFLGGAVLGAFILLTVSVRRGQRTRYLSGTQDMREGRIARSVLTGIRTETGESEKES